MSAPIDRLLGAPGASPQCRVFGEGVAVHWWPRDAVPGDACLCGKTVMREEPLYDAGCNRCGGEGYIIVCPDDICRGAGECMHGDGEIPCPECDHWGEPGERVSSFGGREIE